MKAAILYSADSLPVYGDFAAPPPGPDRQIVELVAAGIHHITRSVAAGRHYGSGGAYPLVPGLNAVARTADGRLVFTSSAPPPYGTFAELIASPDAMRFPVPAGARPEAVAGSVAEAVAGSVAEAVAAGVNPGMASWLPLKARQASAGKLATVLVLGVTGMSGSLAVQNARLLGAARVVGAGRSRPGLDRAAAAGAETVALTGDRDTDAEALATTLDGDAPGLVLDFVWGPVAETAFQALGRQGLSEDTADISYVHIGALAGAEAAVPSALLRSRKLTISGSGAGSVPAAQIKAEIPAYIQLIADGSVQVPFRTFSLSDVAAAWAASAESGPRVVLVRG
jgi:NADPH:quinone reductase-like Zn-dependent oxidoreductase